jgi:hypothetical protein
VIAADVKRQLLVKVDPAGQTSVIAGGGATLGDGGPAREAHFFDMQASVAVSSDGTIYVADGKQGVRKIDPAGIITTIPNTDGAYHVALDKEDRLFYYSGGTVYKMDSAHPMLNNTTIRSFTVLFDGSVLYWAKSVGDALNVLTQFPQNITVVPPAAPGYLGDPGSSLGAKFGANLPSMAVDSKKRVYIADTDNGRIRRLVPGALVGVYNVETFLGGDSPLDCSGIVRKNVRKDNLEKEINVSLATLCLSKPTAFALREQCYADGEGQITMAVAQTFGQRSNIIRIRRPCWF